MVRHTISIPDEMSSYIEGQVKERQYGNVSEYFRALVYRNQQQRQSAIAELKALIEKAEASEVSDLTMNEIRERVRKDLGPHLPPFV